MRLIELIRYEINKSGGKITFDRFMEMALTEPGYGYYVSGNQKFGEAGDFVTAPEVSSLLFCFTLRRVIICLTNTRFSKLAPN